MQNLHKKKSKWQKRDFIYIKKLNFYIYLNTCVACSYVGVWSPFSDQIIWTRKQNKK